MSRLALAAAVAAVSCASVPEIEPLHPGSLVVAFGNSLTSGAGARPDESYPAVLEALTGLRVINAGVAGELSGEGVERLPGVLDEHRPALLILCHGGNDLLRKESEAALAENLRHMVREARQRGIPVVLIGVPRPGLFRESAGVYGDIAEEYGLPYDGEILPEIESTPSLKADPIHPNGDGYRKLAGAVHRLLRDSGALPSAAR